FQAEDGIRDFHVTGVQTCALPISLQVRAAPEIGRDLAGGEVVLGDGEFRHQDLTSTRVKSSMRLGSSCWLSIALARRNSSSASLCSSCARLVLSVSGRQKSAASRAISARSKKGGKPLSSGRKM